jgi:hypothetical protein
MNTTNTDKTVPSAPAKRSYAAEVIADNTGEWVGNGLRFATRAEAEAYVLDVQWRWTAVRDTRVVESKDAVNNWDWEAR